MMNVNQLKTKSILVAGDVMLDNYFLGDIKRISPEAPVPVFLKKGERSTLGGAANVAANLIAAGQKVSVLSMVGNDEKGREILDLFNGQSIGTDLIIIEQRCTTVKTRFLAGNNQQVIRLDIEDTYDLSDETCDTLLKKLESSIDQFDLILLSDYMKGLLTPRMSQGIIKMAKAHGIPVIVDVKDPQCSKYNGAFLLKPNRSELRALTGMPVETDQDVINASVQLRERCACSFVLSTLGAKGMALIGNEKPYFVRSVGNDVFDVSGAGDTTIAYVAACLANNWPVKEAVDYANLAAGIQVGKVGTSSVTPQEIRQYLSESSHHTSHKILTKEDVVSFRKNHAGQKIVFTNGCFDILHVGHKRYLQQAADLGDLLVIGVNSDRSVRRLKGDSRPINNEQERSEMLCAFGFVDYVPLFDDDTPLELIATIQPDILVKGGDYTPDQVVGREIVETNGGVVRIIPFVPGKSTTNILNKFNKD